MRRKRLLIGWLVLEIVCATGVSAAISDSDLKTLKENFQFSLVKRKGPYAENFCVCDDGSKESVALSDGVTIRAKPCGSKGVIFCAAWRAPWGEALAAQGLYIGNIFSRDLHEWDLVKNHHDQVRGYILEDYFVQSHPKHKFAELRAYGGLSGAEYEAPDAQAFFEKYLTSPDFSDFRHYLLLYELRRRFYSRSDIGQIQTARGLASKIESLDRSFKYLADSVHNRVSASLIPPLEEYRDAQPEDSEARAACAQLIEELRKLTNVTEADLAPQVAAIADASLRDRFKALLPTPKSEPLPAISALCSMMAGTRQMIATKTLKPEESRHLVELAIIAGEVLHNRTTALLEGKQKLTLRQGLELLQALTEAAYGTGLLSQREREAAQAQFKKLLKAKAMSRSEFYDELQKAERVVEWAQNTTRVSFSEVMPVWTAVMPDVEFVGDDILRSSPLLVYAQVFREIEDHVSKDLKLNHEILGQKLSGQVRALNPGLAIGSLKFDPEEGGYTRENIVALTHTPPELQPLSGILTAGEGNVVSHVQLLARSLGIPNVVLDPELMQKVGELDGTKMFFMATPMGRVFLKEASKMTDKEQAVYAEYTKNKKRSGEGKLGSGGARLHIDRSRIDLSDLLPLDLKAIRKKDSGARTGPKAAFLGELKFLFPDRVSRGIVLPFGIYYEHYRRAVVHLPEGLKEQGIAKEGESLPKFAERTYAEFFGKLLKSKKTEVELSAWIKPRLEILQFSIRATPISPALKKALWEEFARQGLMKNPRTGEVVGCFVRSDTNVEDLQSFNGAGLNLTIFNLTNFDKILDGVKEVWASPFSMRSFSWRQTLIDEPLWVLPSIVILESVPSEKSGVLISADVATGDTSKMTIGISEGVGGAVDGTPAETLLWSSHGVELLAQYKSALRRMLKSNGGIEMLPSTGKETVLEPKELEQIVSATQTIKAKIEPELDSAKKPRPWDIEFGFVAGKLWLFQVRAFVGNDEVSNLPALRALDQVGDAGKKPVSLEENLR